MEIILIIMLSSFLAGFVQGLTGFGSAIIIMSFLPIYLNVLESSAVVGVITLIHSIAMVWFYRHAVQVKYILYPAILFMLGTTGSIWLAQDIDSGIVSFILGAFLILLAIYFLFINTDGFIPNKIQSFLFILASGITNGLFGIGGPLMVIYFLSKTIHKKEYLGTTQAFFTIVSLGSIGVRISTGILTSQHLPLIVVGIFFILIGLFLANTIVEKLNEEKIRQFTYVFIGLSGLYNILSLL